MNHLKIFLVEDDDDHAEIIEYSLNKIEKATLLYRANDGEKAISILDDIEDKKVEKPSLILLDINIPKVNGIEVLKAIKARPQFAFIPVIALTTSNSQRDKKLAYENHINSYLLKPADFSKFEETLTSLVNYWSTYNQQANI